MKIRTVLGWGGSLLKFTFIKSQIGGSVQFRMYSNIVVCYMAGLAIVINTMGVQAAESLPPIQVRSNAPQSMERRLNTLEKRFSSETLIEILDQLEALKKEVRELRGSAEEATYALEGVKKRQRNLYLDVDQRLQKLESSGDISQVTPTPKYSERDESISIAATTKPPISKKANSQEARSYQKAYRTLQDRRYNTAIQQLKTFLETYPTGVYADNALYWLGEAFYSRRDFPQAKEAFGKVLEQHPGSSKAADSLLKLGFVEYELGNLASSKQRLGELIGRHPNSTAAKLAEKRLQQLRKQKP